jgi:site-specific DNA-cytosine methylase
VGIEPLVVALPFGCSCTGTPTQWSFDQSNVSIRITPQSRAPSAHRGQVAPTTDVRGLGATVGQRLYTARRHANLTPAEAAAAMGAPADLIIAVETEIPPPADARSRVEALIDELNAS